MILLLGGDFAWSMRERSVQPLFQILLRKFEASDFLTSLLLGSIPACITVLVWPVVSVWSDSTRTRWGRRIPFLFFHTAFIFGAMVGLAYAPDLGVWLQQLMGGTGSPNPYILAVFGLFWIVFEVFAMVTNSVFYGLVNDTVPREMIGRFFGLFRMASLGAGVYFNFSLIGYAETHAKEVFLGIAILYLVGFTVMCMFVKEGTYPPPPPVVENDNLIAKVKRYFRECTQDRFYTIAFITLAMANLMAQPINLFSIYTAKSYGIETAQYGKFLAISYVCSFALSFPLGWLSDRFHPMRTASTCLAVYALAMTAGFFMVHDAAEFGVFFYPHGFKRLFCNHLDGGLPDGLPQVAIQPVLFGLFAAQQLPDVRGGADARLGAQIHGHLVPADLPDQWRTWLSQPRPVGILVPVVQCPRRG
jgi:Na+/melibiose symporter-like transporter